MGFWDAIGAFGNWLQEHLKSILDTVGKVLQSFVVVFRAIMGILGNVFTGHFHIFTAAAHWAGGFFSKLVKNWIPGLIHEVKSVYAKLRAWAKPITDTIHNIRKIQQQYFNQYVKPILNFIQHLRQALLILRLFHVKFAAQLDQRLANIEDQITQRFLTVLREFNLVSDYLNYILDPGGLFDSGLYLQTAMRSIGSLFAALHEAQMGIIGASDLAFGDKYSRNLTAQNLNTTTLDRARSGPTADDQAGIDLIFSNLRAAGYEV